VGFCFGTAFLEMVLNVFRRIVETCCLINDSKKKSKLSFNISFKKEGKGVATMYKFGRLPSQIFFFAQMGKNIDPL
jgi:hypothetical protein